jgi:hypothetical protein
MLSLQGVLMNVVRKAFRAIPPYVTADLAEMVDKASPNRMSPVSSFTFDLILHAGLCVPWHSFLSTLSLVGFQKDEQYVAVEQTYVRSLNGCKYCIA